MNLPTLKIWGKEVRRFVAQQGTSYDLVTALLISNECFLAFIKARIRLLEEALNAKIVKLPDDKFISSETFDKWFRSYINFLENATMQVDHLPSLIV